MPLLSTINQWIDKAPDLIANEKQIPLIEFLEIDMKEELVNAWNRGDTALREGLENILFFRNPMIPAAVVMVWENVNPFLPTVLEKIRWLTPGTRTS